MNTGALLLLAAAIAGPNTSSHQTAHVQPAHVFYLEEAHVPAKQTGPLVAVEVQIGDLVDEGQLLARIDDEQMLLLRESAELERDVAAERANDDIEIEFAIASHSLAENELRKDLEINTSRPGAIPLFEIDRKKLAEHRARLQIESSRKEKRIAEKTALIQNAAVTAADRAIERCRVESPFAGRVVDIVRLKSEWVDVGKPVMHVVRLDKLRVDGLVNADSYDAHTLEGQPVRVDVRLAQGRVESFVGQVVFVNPQVLAGNKYRVRAEIENRKQDGHWLLGPGHTAEMFIQLN